LNHLEFRTAMPADQGFVESLAATVFGWLGDYPSILRGWFQHDGVCTVLAVLDGTPVGYVIWGFVRTAEGAAPVADIVALAVTPSFQRRGLGVRLLERAVATAAIHAEAVGATRVCLSVAEDNEAARALFRRAGFLRLRAEDTRYPTGQRCLRMTRPLPIAPLDEVEERNEVHDHTITG
jgi:ribosomal protein S18 acetylase RimI-like enzyme